MELKEGDLVIVLPKVQSIQAVVDLSGGEIGVICDDSGRFDSMQVYGVLVNGHTYYLFGDEIMKLEEKC